MRTSRSWLSAALLAGTAHSLTLDATSPESISSVAGDISYGMWKWYTGNNTGDVPGNLPAPYYWWEAGAMMMTAVDYWYYTGDTTYNENINQAITWQAGKIGDFVPANQSKDEGKF
jgi:mannan endo-1,6-alpha-mannosidase